MVQADSSTEEFRMKTGKTLVAPATAGCLIGFAPDARSDTFYRVPDARSDTFYRVSVATGGEIR